MDKYKSQYFNQKKSTSNISAANLSASLEAESIQAKGKRYAPKADRTKKHSNLSNQYDNNKMDRLDA